MKKADDKNGDKKDEKADKKKKKGGDEEKPHKKNSLSQMWAQAVDLIIRPSRAQYNVAQLGPHEFHVMGFHYVREDFALKNQRGKLLQCSWYKRVSPVIMI
jgi:hypothetical protein